MTALRIGTQSHHERLEKAVDVTRRCGSLAEYRRLLECFYGFYAPLEAEMERHSSWKRLGWEQRRKTPLLRHDLLTLGGLPPEELPLCQALPNLASLGHLLGSAYVLEGATLGGQVIARHVSAYLGLTSDTGAAFFHSYGPEVGRMWKTFRTQLASEAGGLADQEEAVTAACDTFTTLERWFCGQEQEKTA